MRFAKQKNIENLLAFGILLVLGAVMIYPLLWLFGSAFKLNEDIFAGISIFPTKVTLSGFVNGWRGSGQYTYGNFFLNTFSMVLPTVVGTVVSSFLVAYGFARFNFRFKKILFMIMLATLMLPNELIIIPRYIMFNKFGWLNSYLPIVMPAMFATYPFFVFMIVQFLRGIPKELDESAVIDGCNSFVILVRILLPLSKPVIFSATIFQFVWRWNDFFNPLIFIDSVSKYPLSLALRMSIDVTDMINWNNIMAMSILSILPPMLLYFFAQKYFVEGIATTGLKG
jgi:oligogalacturonide transport system permease protein